MIGSRPNVENAISLLIVRIWLWQVDLMERPLPSLMRVKE